MRTALRSGYDSRRNAACNLLGVRRTGQCNDRIAAQVEKAGYIAGVAGTVGVNTNKVPLMQLRRVNVFQNKPEDIGCFIYELHKAQLISYIAQTGIDPGWLLAWYHRIRG